MTKKQRTAGEVIRDWRLAKDMTLERAAVYASDKMHFEMNRETLRRIERDGKDPLTVPAVVWVALAEVYGADTKDLPEAIQDVISVQRELLIGSPGWLREQPRLFDLALATTGDAA